MKNSFLPIAQRVFDIEIRALQHLCARLDETFHKAVEEILKCQGHVFVSGVGKSGHIARKISATLASTGTPSFFIHPAEALHGDLGMITPKDLFISLSKSGETEEFLLMIPFLKKYHIKHIAILGNLQSTLAKHADIVLDASVNEEACPLQLAPTSSTTVSLVLGDALAVALMEARGFQPSDFALFHPGGSLGKKLLTKVKDEMHTQVLPVVAPSAPLRRVVQVMSEGAMGLAVVVNSTQEVLGIITDGDVRRAIANGNEKNFFELTAEKLMNPSPKTIEQERPLAEAEEIMNQHSINALLVTEQRKLVGILLRLIPRKRL
ncbi:MAG: KpsF/GutQ family sugar-phosphate isomerase [Cytophagales bacterium]|nr:KpsF/GutQ family sugar-phosphate isomerase [Cytophagales bacterium]MDW8385062.1 KpsF/GutQ family sugar-phosphate isomerase [Flammeovirgaceae bacterium]